VENAEISSDLVAKKVFWIIAMTVAGFVIAVLSLIR
jgi:hypothetical protein